MIRRADATDDYEVCAAIKNAIEPDDPVTAGQLAEARGVLLLHGRDGFAFVDRSSVPDSAYAMVRVRPEARRRGIGESLLAAAADEAARLGCRSIWGRVAALDGASLAFVLRRGFREETRDVVVGRTIRPCEGEVAAGIVELREEHLRGAYEVVVECMPEIAVPQRAEAAPFEEWLDREHRGSAAAFVALDGPNVVGYARLLDVPAVPGRLENGLTAVRPSHRRRGIATALKRAQFAWASKHGFRELVTSMVAGNEAMRAVNERLGYRPLDESIVVQGWPR